MEALYENRININDLLANGKVSYVSSREALSDVIPIKWSEEVTSGTKKVILTPIKDKEDK